MRRIPAAMPDPADKPLPDQPAPRPPERDPAAPARALPLIGALPATRYVALAAVATALAGAMALVGWLIDSAALKSLEMPVPMSPATADCFLLCGASLWLLRPTAPAASRRVAAVSRGLALLVACVGLVKVLELFLGWESGIDKVLFASAPYYSLLEPRTIMVTVGASFF